jgi:hypothetical protein
MSQNKNDHIHISACFRTGELVFVHVMMYGGEEL